MIVSGHGAYSFVFLLRSRSCLSNLAARETTDPLQLSHLSVLFSLLQLSVLSCLVITIRGSISSLFFTTVLRLIFLASPSVLFFFLFFGSKWPFRHFSEVIWFESKILKFRNIPTLFFIDNQMLRPLSSFF